MGYLLDTVTLSELRRGKRAEPAVVRWQATLAGQPGYVSLITLNELWYGIRKIEERDKSFAVLLEKWYLNLLAQPDIFPVLNVDRAIAERGAEYRAAHSIPYNDAFIAGTASEYHFTLATRNTADFRQTGIIRPIASSRATRPTTAGLPFRH